MRKPDHFPVNPASLSPGSIVGPPLRGAWCRHLVFVGLLVALFAPSVTTAESRNGSGVLPALRELPQGFSLEEREPGAVEFLGPDGRRWQVRGNMRAGPGVSLADVRLRIEQAWSAAMPRLDHARPALFEEGPGARIWFIVHGNRYLLGYDGQDWIQRDAMTPRGFVGRPAGHGRLFWAEANLQIGANRFFLEGDGVHVFDGRDWSFQPFNPVLEPVDFGRSFGRPMLVPVMEDGVRKNPQAQVFVVLPTGNLNLHLDHEDNLHLDHRDNLHRNQLLVNPNGKWLMYQQGRWTLTGLRESDGPNQRSITHAASIPQGLLVLHHFGRVGLLNAPHLKEKTTQALGEVPELIRQLDDPQWRARETAHQRLMELRNLIEQPLRQAREQADDPDIRERLNAIIDAGPFLISLQYSNFGVAHNRALMQLERNPAHGQIGSRSRSPIPEQSIPVSIIQAGDGMVMILSAPPQREGRGGQWMAGIRRPDGTWRTLPIDESIVRPQMSNPMPALHAGHQRYWLGGDRRRSNATLIDISGDRVRVLARSPEPYATVLYARPNGEALLAPFDPLNYHADQPLLRYRPDVLMELGIHVLP